MAAADVERALLAAIRAAPYDEAPLRVYCDWLLERDDARGPFIVATLARDAPEPPRPSPSPDGARRGEPPSPRWTQELAPLAARAAAAWAARLGAGFAVDAEGFARGLPGHISFAGSVEALATHVLSIAPLLPRSTSIELRGQSQAAVLLSRSDWRVAALIEPFTTTTGLAYWNWFGVRVVELPSLVTLAERERDVAPDNEPIALVHVQEAPLHLRFAPDVDELRWFVSDYGLRRVLPFTTRR